MNYLHKLGLIVALAVSAQLTGCASLSMSPPKPTMENTVKLRAANPAAIAVGSFTADPAVQDKSISMRGANSVASPVNGSFAQYLGETLKVELQAAGLLDPASGAVVSGTLTRSELDAAMSTGTGELAARFVVTRNGAVNYNRELKVSSTWESSFIGAVAIPAAAAQYEGMYRKLVGVLFDDPDFLRAVPK